jgi:group I intron endonuclease
MAAAPLSGIYEIVNLVNGKRYVGSAVNLMLRWRQHRGALRGNNHGNRHLQSSWGKHGEPAFAFAVIETCDPSDLLTREQATIDRLCPEFNICPTAGSTLGRRHSKQTRDKIAAKRAGTKMPPRSAEHRAKMSAIHRGRKKPDHVMAALQLGRSRQEFTEERRTRVSEALRASYDNGERSKERPPEYREKIAATLRERAKSPEVKEQLRKQAAEAWAQKSQAERDEHMKMVRAARSK